MSDAQQDKLKAIQLREKLPSQVIFRRATLLHVREVLELPLHHRTRVICQLKTSESLLGACDPRKGLSKAEIAEKVGRSEHWVKRRGHGKLHPTWDEKKLLHDYNKRPLSQRVIVFDPSMYVYIYIYICIGFRIEPFWGEAPGIAENPKCRKEGTPRIAIPPSPTWHRRRRRLRARARKQIWAARSKGRPGPLRAAAYLAAHHSRPQYRELMSGNKWREPWQRDSAEDTYQSYYTDKSARSKGGKGWGYWRGSWGSPRASHGQQERYDTVQLPQERPQPQPCLSLFAGDTIAPSAPPTMKEIQKYLTQAQRADTKLRKLREEQDKRSKQWAAYEQQMKQKFAKQRKLFEADLQRIAREANEAAEQGQLAAQLVKEVVNYGRVEAEDTMEEDNEAWDNLMRGEQDERLQDGFLKMALHATARQEASARLQGTSTAAVVRSSAEMGPDPFTRTGGPPTGAAHQGIGHRRVSCHTLVRGPDRHGWLVHELRAGGSLPWLHPVVPSRSASYRLLRG